MSRRLRSRQLLSAVMTLASACTTFVPISPRVGLNQRELEVRFTTPRRQLVARSHTGAEVVRRDVTRAVGRLLEVRDDTLVLEITRWQGFRFWRHESPPLVAALPADASTDIGTRHFSGRRTAALILGPPVIAFALLLMLCPTMDCFMR